ncbi:MAG: DUF262 domain-containing HNH endonuclease family protein [Saprospiraceae bacterium]|nr:DUF262 domain-containing HNH endonuclease family protein [Saprospiraceae bacterium]MCF8249595.1 DUF262 domain-containing HNH endonuclease family protein [Saprospiraceae bacterium]MCF8280495.1 DUF262 domain-containing HNH endonuclease family protein [Bacteroidales bacterium]MCF8310427.1 DUF262 domain-containing HNH endonuclease family protein [Saprospiraceae bacterium]MCF8439805.1 DUF262 domain-containing HNH endonuclease family protein [Saprospiraceae bacterium]
MSQLDKISISLKGIGQYLKLKRLMVPKYQRDYAWDEKHVNDLLLDIANALQNEEKEYFIGSIVVKNNENDRTEVVDGQQRLATITIIINCIKSIFEREGNERKAFQISNDFLMTHELRTEEDVPRLILNENDHDFFFSHVLNNKPNLSTKKEVRVSHQKLLDAKEAIEIKLSQILAANNQNSDVLIDWVEYIESNVKVIWVEVPDYANAFTIFETLNDRGIDLAISDLLKNYLFHKSASAIKQAQQNWLTMVSVLESADSNSTVVPYIKYLWASYYGNVREKELYTKIKDTVKTKTKALEFSNQLSDNSNLYTALLYSDHYYWSEYSTATRRNIRTINELGMVQIRPLLLSMLPKFDKKETEKSLESIVSLIVRLIVSGTLSSGIFERQFSITAMKIRNGEIKNRNELLESLKTLTPSDERFKEAFQTFTISNSSIAKYLLSTIENYRRNDQGSDLIPNNDETIVNLEHILPKKLNEQWPDFDEDEHRLYFKRLGNMTILNSRKNSRIGNKSYNEKIPVFSESEFIITKEISSNTVWNKESINDRQNQFALDSIKCWKMR